MLKRFLYLLINKVLLSYHVSRLKDLGFIKCISDRLFQLKHTLLKLGYFQAHPANLCVIDLHTWGLLAKPTSISSIHGARCVGCHTSLLSDFVFYRTDKPFATLPGLAEISLWDQKLLVEKDRADWHSDFIILLS